MGKIKSRMDERILVCVYYGPNGERLIRRGYELSQLSNSPFYVLTVDQLSSDEFDAEKASYIEQWHDLAEELGAEKFILKDSETRPIVKVIKEVAYKYNITQVIIGEKPQNRWEEITKGSFVNALLRELVFVDVHVVSVDRALKVNDEAMYEKGIRGYLKKDEAGFVLSFTKSKHNLFAGVFYKEIGTDFNNGIFKYVCGGKSHQVRVTEDHVVDEIKETPNININEKPSE
ncbi:histidine kinase [Pseudogracilibacillus sp. SO30301A]|uniref:histidine kinase n=1 Tax=Pseudogracilibacillus sp. SO30301A TaxID=3098291 RepID=UPI00300DD1D9